MSDAPETHNAPTETEKLRHMTGAPDINQPLVTKDAFADVEVSSQRPLWKLPLPKLTFIGLLLVPVFGFAGFFLVGDRTSPQQAAIPPDPIESDESPAKEEDNTDLQKAEQEIAKLKSQMALDDQAYVKQTQRSSQPVAGQLTNNTTEKTPQSKPEPVRATAPIAPTMVSARSPSPTQSSPRIVRSAEPISQNPSTTATAVQRDPFEQWQQLARLGSYGSLPASEIAASTDTTNPDASETTGIATGATPAAYFAQTSATPPTYRSAIFRAEVEGDSPVTESGSTDSKRPADIERPVPSVLNKAAEPDEPAILTEAESRLLDEQDLNEQSFNEQNLSEQSQTQALTVGGQAQGQLVTPVVLDSEGVEDRFLVVLSEALKDNAGRIAIPADSVLVVQVDRTSEDGLVQLSATQAIWEEQGLQRELVLPRRTILIRGEGGNPLMAESYGDSGGDIAAMDFGQFALGAIQRVGELYTRSDSRVQTGDGTTIITESNPAPDILAGALEGGSNAVLDSIIERNQRAIEKLENRPRIPYIASGTSVQVFVNQSMQMPARF
ncbi:MAG: hypothetical protein AAFO06_11020 [Cyanobacteria bacterium J06597_16]